MSKSIALCVALLLLVTACGADDGPACGTVICSPNPIAGVSHVVKQGN